MSAEFFSNPQTWISLFTLTALELVLGIDNIIFISILAGRLPKAEQPKARNLGLGFALVSRLILLSTIAWIVKLGEPIFELFGRGISVRDLILLGGGLFLIAKATVEIYRKVEHSGHGAANVKVNGLWNVIFQIALIDIVFSLDSVITAVGMVQHLSIMVAAVVISMILMILFAGPVSRFVEHHPSIKILALSFLVMIGVLLVAEGFGEHLNKGYVYFGMAFSLFIEMLNMRYEKKNKPVGA